MRTRTLAGGWLAVSIACGAAVAEDTPSTPRERAAKALAGFPAPDAATGFSYEMEIFQGEKGLGSATLSAEPSIVDGKPGWKTENTVEVPSERFARAVTAWLTPALALARITQSDVTGDRAREALVVRTPKGFDVTVGEGGERTARAIEAPEGAVSTLPGLLLFLRQAPAEPATYAVDEVRWDENPPVRETVVETKGPATIDTASGPRAALLVELTRSKDRFSLHLDAKDRSLLMITHGPMVMTRKGLRAPPGAQAAPASAKDVVSRMAIAWAKADAAAFTALLHWPSLHVAAGATQALEEFRTEQEAALRERMPDPDADAASKIERAMRTAMETKAADGSTEVTADFGRGPVTTTAREIDGRWWVVALPR